jgi:hypothetical protein
MVCILQTIKFFSFRHCSALIKPDSSKNPFCLQYLSFTVMLRYEASAAYETDAGSEHNSTSKRLKRMAGLSQPIKTGPCFSDKNALFFCHGNTEHMDLVIQHFYRSEETNVFL